MRARLNERKQAATTVQFLSREAKVARQDIEIVVPRWTLQTDGKVPGPTCVKAEKKLRAEAARDADARRVIEERYELNTI